MMLDYIAKIQRKFVDEFGFPSRPDAPGIPAHVPDGVYPMEIDGQTDHVEIKNGMIHCCRAADDEIGKAKAQAYEDQKMRAAYGMRRPGFDFFGDGFATVRAGNLPSGQQSDDRMNVTLKMAREWPTPRR